MKVIKARASEGRKVLEIGLPGSLGWLLFNHWPSLSPLCSHQGAFLFGSSSKTRANVPLTMQETNLCFNCQGN